MYTLIELKQILEKGEFAEILRFLRGHTIRTQSEKLNSRIRNQENKDFLIDNLDDILCELSDMIEFEYRQENTDVAETLKEVHENISKNYLYPLLGFKKEGGKNDI